MLRMLSSLKSNDLIGDLIVSRQFCNPGQASRFVGDFSLSIQMPLYVPRSVHLATRIHVNPTVAPMGATLYKLSRRILVDAVNIFPAKNMDVPIQLTLLAWAETVTVMVEPGGAELSDSGLSVTEQVTPEFDNID